MTRLDRVKKCVTELIHKKEKSGSEPCVTIREVSKTLSIWPNDASVELNKLVASGYLTRKGTRGIKFYLASPDGVLADDKISVVSEKPIAPISLPFRGSDSPPPFLSYVGANGSLRSQIQMAKAAVTYPPYGLHTLIVGETGVGKTKLALEMWNYANQKRAAKDGQPPVPFIHFNCAEYADNPQLLLSQLFGHSKGAFTGADNEKHGLVEEANGGILLLDEIHRLPPAGQELFFKLIDTGTIRRLGDTVDRPINLMIIGTTTEDISAALLSAFKRRFSVFIDIPGWVERPPRERIALIKLFLGEESRKIKRPIFITGKALAMLFSYKGKGNIGDLKNAIKLACAKSYLLSSSSSTEEADPNTLCVGIYSLSQQVYDGLEDIEELIQLIDEDIFAHGIKVFPDENPQRYLEIDSSMPDDLYSLLERQLHNYKDETLVISDWNQSLALTIKDYFENQEQTADLYSFISPEIDGIAGELLAKASTSLKRDFPSTLRGSLALHLQQYYERAKSGSIIYNPELKNIELHYPEEMQILKKMQPHLSKKLKVQVTNDELGFLALFLRKPRSTKKVPKVGLLLVLNGQSASHSLAYFANEVFCTSHVHWVNAGNKSLEHIFKEVCQVVSTFNQGKGFMILTDIDVLTTLEKEVQKETGIPCRIVSGANSSLILDACSTVLHSDNDLDTAHKQVVKQQLRRFISTYSSELDEVVIQERAQPLRPEKNVIMTICATGIGSANSIKNILLERLPNSNMFEIVPCSIMNDLNSLVDSLGSRLMLVIGTVDPKIPQVPFLPVNNVFTRNGIHKIYMYANGWYYRPMQANWSKNHSRFELISVLEQNMKRFAPSLDHNVVTPLVRKLVNLLEQQFYNGPLPTDVIGRLYFHSASMVERLQKGITANLCEADIEEINRNRDQFDVLKQILNQSFGELLDIPDSEVYYFMLSIPELPENTEGTAASL